MNLPPRVLTFPSQFTTEHTSVPLLFIAPIALVFTLKPQFNSSNSNNDLDFSPITWLQIGKQKRSEMQAKRMGGKNPRISPHAEQPSGIEPTSVFPTHTYATIHASHHPQHIYAFDSI